MEKDCPIDNIQINENSVRVVALFVLILVFSTLFIHPLPVFIFLAIDFFLRAFNFGQFSLLNILSGIIIKQFKIKYIAIDRAPKRFATGIGFVLSILIVILLLTHFLKAVLFLTVVFASFAFLESFLSFCAGCYVYTFLRRLKIIG